MGDEFYGQAVEAALKRKDQNRVFLAYISWWEQAALSGNLSIEGIRETGNHLEAIWKSNAKLQRDYNLLWPALRERAYAHTNSSETRSLDRSAMLSSHGRALAANIGSWTDKLVKMPSWTDTNWTEGGLVGDEPDLINDENETKLLLQYHNP